MASTSGLGPEPVSVQSVVARVQIRALDQGRSSTLDFDELEPASLEDDTPAGSLGRAGFAVPWADIFPTRSELVGRLPSAGAEGVLAAAATWMITQNERFAVVLGVVVGVAAILRTLDRRITFSFGSGFLGYRADMDWPQGVQEDDDVHWRWRPTESGHVNQPS